MNLSIEPKKLILINRIINPRFKRLAINMFLYLLGLLLLYFHMFNHKNEMDHSNYYNPVILHLVINTGVF